MFESNITLKRDESHFLFTDYTVMEDGEVVKTYEWERDNVLQTIREASLLNYKCHTIAEEYARLTGQYYSSYAKINGIDEQTIDFKWDEPCSRSCCSDYYALSFPTSYLWDDKWKDALKAEQAEKERLKKEKANAEALAKSAADKEAKAAAKVREREEYLRLKAKFES